MAAGTPYLSTQEVLSRSFDATAEGLRAAPLSDQIKASAVTVGVAAAVLLASSLANRKVLMIRPASDIYIGPTNGVTTANGFTLAANTTTTLEVGPNVTIYAIGGGAGINVRVLEIA